MAKQEDNFVPNYAECWANPDFKKEELLWLILGVNPDDVERDKELQAKPQLTPEEQQWRNRFFDYYDNIDTFIGNTIKQHTELLIWKDSKQQFVKDAYEFHMSINEQLLDYLIGIGEFERNPKLESYKDYSQYILDEEKLLIDKIKTAEEAFAVLAGVKPEFFCRYLELDKKNHKIPNDKSGYVAYIHFSPEDKWFFSSYRKFLSEQYSHLDMFSDKIIITVFNKAKSFNLWDGSFVNYVQSLHDEGFIFRSTTYSFLKTHEIEPQYSETAWAVRFYQRWMKEGLWSVKEALALLQGKDPRKDKRGFEDLSQNPFVVNFMSDEVLAWEIFDEDYYPVEERLKKHVLAEYLLAYEHGDTFYYKPKDIIEWMMTHVPINPPKALLDTVFTVEEAIDTQKKLLQHRRYTKLAPGLINARK